MLIGAHESIAGGVQRAFERGAADGCEALQIFTSFNSRWAPRPLPPDEVVAFRDAARLSGWQLMSHASYLINIATPDEALWRRSVAALREELVRCERLGIDFLVLHPGAHVGSGVDAGIARVAAALGEVHAACRGFRVRVALENTAGQGTLLGSAIAELARMLDATPQGDRLVICIDTCHAFAAGYDLRRARGYEEFVEELDRELGLERVACFHLNDSLKAHGSRRDRHAHIGAGEIGSGAFRRLVNDRRFAGVPGVVETPPEEDGSMSFARNIRALKALRRVGRF